MSGASDLEKQSILEPETKSDLASLKVDRDYYAENAHWLYQWYYSFIFLRWTVLFAVFFIVSIPIGDQIAKHYQGDDSACSSCLSKAISNSNTLYEFQQCSKQSQFENPSASNLLYHRNPVSFSVIKPTSNAQNNFAISLSLFLVAVVLLVAFGIIIHFRIRSLESSSEATSSYSIYALIINVSLSFLAITYLVSIYQVGLLDGCYVFAYPVALHATSVITLLVAAILLIAVFVLSCFATTIDAFFLTSFVLILVTLVYQVSLLAAAILIAITTAKAWIGILAAIVFVSGYENAYWSLPALFPKPKM